MRDGGTNLFCYWYGSHGNAPTYFDSNGRQKQNAAPELTARGVNDDRRRWRWWSWRRRQLARFSQRNLLHEHIRPVFFIEAALFAHPE